MCVYPYITQRLHISNKILYLCLKRQTMDGLKMKDGREINERPDGVTGIAMAAKLRSEFKSSKTVRNIADGIELAEQRKAANEAMMKSLKNFMKL